MPRELRPLQELLNSANELIEAQQNLSRIKKDAGLFLRDAREAKGVSQSFLAAGMGVTRSYIAQVENGHTTPTANSLQEAYQVISDYKGDKVGDNKAKGHIEEARSKHKKNKKGRS